MLRFAHHFYIQISKTYMSQQYIHSTSQQHYHHAPANTKNTTHNKVNKQECALSHIDQGQAITLDSEYFSSHQHSPRSSAIISYHWNDWLLSLTLAVTGTRVVSTAAAVGAIQSPILPIHPRNEAAAHPSRAFPEHSTAQHIAKHVQLDHSTPLPSSSTTSNCSDPSHTHTHTHTERLPLTCS